MTQIVWFDDTEGTTVSKVGGKGANLASLTAAGFPVPSGFVITTDSYASFLGATELDVHITEAVEKLHYDDPSALEAQTAEIRRLVMQAEVPAALAASITKAYEQLGENQYVAVRSSGTAEDLEGASFAGLHDTYLDIRGADALIDAVRRCWGSLWTARATSYRQTRGFDHLKSPIAIVVQTMVESDVSGVLFTANPINAATDEVVINASWGLGEAIVGGVTSPDQFVLKSGTLQILERALGAKEVRIVRDPSTGTGTITEPNNPDDQRRYSLTDQQAQDLAALGLRIQSSYEDFPQDIEWGLVDGQLQVLQARPITGVDFSWDADVTASIPGNDRDADQPLWSRAWADEVWTGAVTPLMFSWRGTLNTLGLSHSYHTLGYDEVDYSAMRLMKFHRGTVYYNPYQDREVTEKTMPPAFRPAMLPRLPMEWHNDVQQAPFDLLRYLRGYLRYQLLEPTEALGWTKTLDRYMATETARFDGLDDASVRRLDDRELKRYIDDMINTEGEFYDVVIFGLLFIFRDSLSLLGSLLGRWYDGTNAGVLTDLVTGTRRRTATSKENNALWDLAQRIRTSPTLLSLFRQHKDSAFMDHLQESPDGREFLTEHEQFLHEHGHRGHDDRDIYYRRRAEDPAVDYRAWKAMLSADTTINPIEREHHVNARRELAVDEVVENIRRKPFGALKAEVFKVVLDYVHKCLAARDDERHFVDRSTFAIKKGFQEVNRRLNERGLVESQRDFYFLSRPELYEMLDGHANLRLAKAKIAARMRDFDSVYNKETIPPMYLYRGRPMDLSQVEPTGDGVLRGIGTSRGKVTGTARVIKNLHDIGSLKHGDILVTNSTDPGWTPAFLVIHGIVLETGGLLSHGALLAREYGFPGVQVSGATSQISDGATISIDGDAGLVVLENEPNTEAENDTGLDSVSLAST